MIREAVFGRLLFALIHRIERSPHALKNSTPQFRQQYCGLHCSLELFWCLISQRGMESLRVVIVFDELCNVLAQVLRDLGIRLRGFLPASVSS